MRRSTPHGSMFFHGCMITIGLVFSCQTTKPILTSPVVQGEFNARGKEVSLLSSAPEIDLSPSVPGSEKSAKASDLASVVACESIEKEIRGLAYDSGFKVHERLNKKSAKSIIVVKPSSKTNALTIIGVVLFLPSKNNDAHSRCTTNATIFDVIKM